MATSRTAQSVKMIARRISYVMIVLALAFVTACQPPTPQPTPPPTATATPEHPAPEGLYSPDLRTGIPEVDVFLEAVSNEDLDALQDLVGLSELPCTAIPDIEIRSRRPACIDEEEGTVVSVFMGEGYFGFTAYALEGARNAIVHYQIWNFPLYIHAIYRSTLSIDGIRPAAYEIVLASGIEDHPKTVYLDAAGRIIRVYTTYIPLTELVREGRIVPQGADFILPPSPVPTPTPPQGLYPPNTRTGIPEIDVFLEAVTNADRDALQDLVGLSELPCVEPKPIVWDSRPSNRPACPFGAEEGTVTAVFWGRGYAAFHASSLDEAREALDAYKIWNFPLYVHAIYRSTLSIDGIHPAAYEIVVASNIQDRPKTIYLDTAGRMIRIDTAFGPLTEMAKEGSIVPQGVDFILPPSPVPAPTPIPEDIAPVGLYPPNTRTGIPEIDVVLQAVATKDIPLLKNLVDPTEMPCTTQWYGSLLPICQQGVEEGTPIVIFPYWCISGEPPGGGLHNFQWVYIFGFERRREEWPRYVYAIYRSQQTFEGIRPVAYEVVFLSHPDDHRAMIYFLDAEGRLIGMNCPQANKSMLPEGLDFILPPLFDLPDVFYPA